MPKRNVKTFSICLQPDVLRELEYINSVAGGPDISRSQLIADCIHITYNVLELKKHYEGVVTHETEK